MANRGKGSRRAQSAQPLRWDRILRFVPRLKRAEVESGHWVSQEGYLPWYCYSAEVDALVEVLYEDGWVVAFDWGNWKRGRLLYDHPELLARARTSTLRKLLTLHVRQDRFCEGHLAAVLNDGHILAILMRLEQLHQGGRRCGSDTDHRGGRRRTRRGTTQ